MRNLKFIIFIIIFLNFQIEVSFCCHKVKEITNKNYEVVKIDEKNNRFFVVINEDSVKDTGAMKIIIFDIYNVFKKKYNLKENQFSISFFSEAKYAGYKDETEILDFVMKSEWTQNYLAEYDSETFKLWIYPLKLDKRKFYEIKIPSRLEKI